MTQIQFAVASLTYLQSDSIHIDILWVDEAIRRQGHGKKLLAAAEEEAKKYGCFLFYY